MVIAYLFLFLGISNTIVGMDTEKSLVKSNPKKRTRSIIKQSLEKEYTKKEQRFLEEITRIRNIENKTKLKRELLGIFSIAPIAPKYIIRDIALAKTQNDVAAIASWDLELRNQWRFIYQYINQQSDPFIVHPCLGTYEEIDLVKKIIQAENAESITQEKYNELIIKHEKTSKLLSHPEGVVDVFLSNKEVAAKLLQRIELLKSKIVEAENN